MATFETDFELEVPKRHWQRKELERDPREDQWKMEAALGSLRVLVVGYMYKKQTYVSFKKLTFQIRHTLP